MAWAGEQYRRLKAWLRRDALARELEEEMAMHREMRGAHRFGSTLLAAEDSRALWGWHWMDLMLQDMRFAFRQMKRAPAFTISAVTTLSLGIGAAVLVFAVLHTVVLRPLAFHQPEQLAFVWIHDAKRGIREEGVSWATYRDWLAMNRTFETLSVRGRRSYMVLHGEEPERILVDVVTPNYFSVLGVTTEAGRLFTDHEDEQRQAVIVISHRLALRRFGSVPGAVGEQLVLNGMPWRIAGVMPAGFGIPPSQQDVWMPARSFPDIRAWEARTMDFFMGVGRLKPGITAEAAARDLNDIGKQLEKAYPVNDPDFGGYGVAVVPLMDQVLGHSLPRTLWMLLCAVGLLLLVASVNVANLLLARWKARQGEYAVRAALGAGMGALLRQQWMEGLVLSGCGCVLGLLGARLGLHFVRLAAPSDIPRLEQLSIDPRVTAFAVAASLAACLLFGLLPAWMQARRPPQSYLVTAGNRVTGSVRTMQSVLMAVEMGLAFTLATGAVLFVRSLWNVSAVDAGFESRNAVLAEVDMDSTDRKTDPPAFFRALLERLRQSPGVQAAGAIGDFFIQLNPDYSVTVRGRATESGEQVTVDPVSSSFLQAAGARLLDGRFLNDSDYNSGWPATVVINETFARRFFPSQRAVGQHFKFGTADARGPWIEVVGVIADMHRRGLDRSAVCEGFGPLIGRNMSVLMRTAVAPAQAEAAIRAAARQIGGGTIVHGVTTVEARLQELTANRRIQAWSMTGFALLTVLLAAAGIAGAIQYAVTERRRETAIRMAVGANSHHVRLLVLRHAAASVAAGVVLGCLVVAIAHRAIASLLFGVTALDAMALSIAAAVVTLVAAIACWGPVRHAARMDPACLLRE
ncbi:MAG: ABC transporter permease [Bryobacterales bacterium]|nr:ABC transporter permease [Bryobacterales bacterium]